MLVQYKADLIIISLKINLFSPWYSWKIAELALNNNHSLTHSWRTKNWNWYWAALWYDILNLGTNVVSLNPDNGEVYSIQHYVIKFVNALQQVSGFLWVPWFLFLHQSHWPPRYNWSHWPPRYNWNIVESGVKHHNTNTNILNLVHVLMKVTWSIGFKLWWLKFNIWYTCTTIGWLIDWLVFNAKFSSISGLQ